jgi:hypothetical protein
MKHDEVNSQLERETFLDWVGEDLCLVAWFDAHPSLTEICTADFVLLDRLKYIRANVPDRIRRNQQDALERTDESESA